MENKVEKKVEKGGGKERIGEKMWEIERYGEKERGKMEGNGEKRWEMWIESKAEWIRKNKREKKQQKRR